MNYCISQLFVWAWSPHLAKLWETVDAVAIPNIGLLSSRHNPSIIDLITRGVVYQKRREGSNRWRTLFSLFLRLLFYCKLLYVRRQFWVKLWSTPLFTSRWQKFQYSWSHKSSRNFTVNPCNAVPQPPIFPHSVDSSSPPFANEFHNESDENGAANVLGLHYVQCVKKKFHSSGRGFREIANKKGEFIGMCPKLYGILGMILTQGVWGHSARRPRRNVLSAAQRNIEKYRVAKQEIEVLFLFESGGDLWKSTWNPFFRCKILLGHPGHPSPTFSRNNEASENRCWEVAPARSPAYMTDARWTRYRIVPWERFSSLVFSRSLKCLWMKSPYLPPCFTVCQPREILVLDLPGVTLLSWKWLPENFMGSYGSKCETLSSMHYSGRAHCHFAINFDKIILLANVPYSLWRISFTALFVGFDSPIKPTEWTAFFPKTESWSRLN